MIALYNNFCNLAENWRIKNGMSLIEFESLSNNYSCNVNFISIFLFQVSVTCTPKKTWMEEGKKREFWLVSVSAFDILSEQYKSGIAELQFHYDNDKATRSSG